MDQKQRQNLLEYSVLENRPREEFDYQIHDIFFFLNNLGVANIGASGINNRPDFKITHIGILTDFIINENPTSINNESITEIAELFSVFMRSIKIFKDDDDIINFYLRGFPVEDLEKYLYRSSDLYKLRAFKEECFYKLLIYYLYNYSYFFTDTKLNEFVEKIIEVCNQKVQEIKQKIKEINDSNKIKKILKKNFFILLESFYILLEIKDIIVNYYPSRSYCIKQIDTFFITNIEQVYPIYLLNSFYTESEINQILNIDAIKEIYGYFDIHFGNDKLIEHNKSDKIFKKIIVSININFKILEMLLKLLKMIDGNTIYNMGDWILYVFNFIRTNTLIINILIESIEVVIDPVFIIKLYKRFEECNTLIKNCREVTRIIKSLYRESINIPVNNDFFDKVIASFDTFLIRYKETKEVYDDIEKLYVLVQQQEKNSSTFHNDDFVQMYFYNTGEPKMIHFNDMNYIKDLYAKYNKKIYEEYKKTHEVNNQENPTNNKNSKTKKSLKNDSPGPNLSHIKKDISQKHGHFDLKIDEKILSNPKQKSKPELLQIQNNPGPRIADIQKQLSKLGGKKSKRKRRSNKKRRITNKNQKTRSFNHIKTNTKYN